MARTRLGTTGRAAPAPTPHVRSSGAARLIALQRRAGNSSTVALLRRAHDVREESPTTLTITGVVAGAAVSSWSLGGGPHPHEVNVLRATDADSPRLLRAVTNGETGTATLVVRKLTPLGWVRSLTLTLEGCTVSSYEPGEKDESVGLTFTGMQVEQ